MQHDRIKHVEIDRFFIKEKLDNGLLRLSYVVTGEQVTDYLTKGLISSDLTRFCDKMGFSGYLSPTLRSVEIY
jgi:hypothetical protein